MTASAVLLAAGRGRRMGLEVNKAFLPISGTPLVTRAAAALAQSPDIDELIVVAHPDEMGTVAAMLPAMDIPVRIVSGGAERHDSARAGVAVVTGDIVLVHDAARPFVSPELIHRVLQGARRCGACIPVIRVVDTLRRVETSGLACVEAIDRTGLVRVQTPQGFRTDLLRAALAAWADATPPTDDAAAVLAYGSPVSTVEGDMWNIKLTTPEDREFAARVAAGWEVA